ncbi:MAG: hypothetical protein U0235_14495 [Polyangiaceae bacterium]
MWVATVDDDVVGFISVHLDEPVEMVLSAVAARRARRRGRLSAPRGRGPRDRASARQAGDLGLDPRHDADDPARGLKALGLLPHRSLYTFHKWYAP